jgi:ubiquinone/menaquinone biosynthesis C-methylase UbiE
VTTAEDLARRIEDQCAAHPDLAPIRAHNQWMIREFGRMVPLEGAVVLDVGASIHGFALEEALLKQVARYEGVNFDVERHWGRHRVDVVTADGRVGRLRQMNAEAMDFPADVFDGIITFGTFEHFERPGAVLDEMHRVLKPGGRVLVTFGPPWSASYGHHLHHWGLVSHVIPPWAHLVMDEDQMADALSGVWPADAPLTCQQALRWIYRDRDINRLTVGELRAVFAASKLNVVWEVPLRDEATPEKLAAAPDVSRRTGIPVEDLMTRGLSLMLDKA